MGNSDSQGQASGPQPRTTPGQETKDASRLTAQGPRTQVRDPFPWELPITDMPSVEELRAWHRGEQPAPPSPAARSSWPSGHEAPHTGIPDPSAVRVSATKQAAPSQAKGDSVIDQLIARGPTLRDRDDADKLRDVYIKSLAQLREGAQRLRRPDLEEHINYVYADGILNLLSLASVTEQFRLQSLTGL